mgnify:CR=1 FL=1
MSEAICDASNYPALSADERYANWHSWWLVHRFKEKHPHDIPTPGHVRVFAAIVDGLGSPWNIATTWTRCRWYHTAKGAVSFALRTNGLSTYDHDKLTRLVLAAHRHQVRVEIKPCNMQYVRVIFWPRDLDDDSFAAGHPTLADLARRALDEDF